MAVFKRMWSLSVEINNNLKTFKEMGFKENSLKIDFNIKNYIGGAFASGDITIFNLSQNDMQFLATSYNFKNGNFKRNKVSLVAGYENNLGMLISGNINEADANFEAVDKSITLKIMCGIQNNLSNNSIQTSINGNIDFKTICNECAKKNNLKLDYGNDVGTRKITDFAFQGTPFQYIEKLREFYSDLNIYINETAEVLKVEKKENKSINTQILSNETGLIGKPKPTWLGCNVRTLLNPSFRAGGFVNLQNEVLKSFNGIYKINEITHRGSNRGDLWESELILMRV